MYLFFDTETTGLPKNYKASLTDFDNWPRMVQIAWQKYSETGVLLESRMYIIKPEGYIIPKEASKVHGITTERAVAEGVDLTGVLNEFRGAMLDSEALVAHNINFDEKIVGVEFLRKKIEKITKKLPRIDTMTESTNYCAIPGKYGFKWPNLTELHHKLFGTAFDGAHDALADVKACADCFFELKKRKVIKVGL
jgi:DNA polymerase III epsilon subunit-like protein